MKTKTVKQTIHEKLLADVEAASNAKEARMAELEAQRVAEEQKHDALIAEANAKLNRFLLNEKLKEFPEKLVKDHPTCSVCGADMRPHKSADADGNIVKRWACSAGNLSPAHDLIAVDG